MDASGFGGRRESAAAQPERSGCPTLADLTGPTCPTVVETDSPADLAETTAKFTPFADFQIEPVLDVADAVGAAQAAIEFRESIG